ncbi:DUF1491 family protein [Novosphingobium sp. 1949]|uniref:DUF1491 family protein n=1 Tax=Novosphingobium organovorum TaxID=2930092 RepID=A0ABT0BAX8_9SPHN|nr:DUF1491 family protein [Novosphingobium organovorum]MCJ2182217.1 DUF1491 family protein [Novosphingobium organovorum]
MDARLPAHLEVSGLIRRVEAEGGFGMVLHKGERDAGTIIVVLTCRGQDSAAYERMPQLDGTRHWTLSKAQDPVDPFAFSEFLDRRARQDPDVWIVELDVANGTRFLAT